MTAELEPPDTQAGGPARSRPPAVEHQITALKSLTRDQLLERLRQAARERDLLPEALLHLVRHAHNTGDDDLYWAAFAALVKTATPMIASRMRGVYRMTKAHDLKDHQQMVFADLLERVHVNDDQLDFGERRFAKFLKCRSIDAMRKSSHPWAMSVKTAVEKLTLEEQARKPWGDLQVVHDSNGKLVKQPDPLNQSDVSLDPQERALGEQELDALRRRVEHLPEKMLRAYFESQVLQRTHPQIAKQLGASERTVRTWIKTVAEAVGQRKEHE